MNYDNHPDFNKARTPAEATKRFAADRERTFIRANDDFNVGMKYGIALIPLALSITWLTLSSLSLI